MDSRYVRVMFLFSVFILIFIVSSTVLANLRYGANLSAEKTANAFWKQKYEYDWTITKSADPTIITLDIGKSETITYTLQVTRSPRLLYEVYSVSGEISVTNKGDEETKDLKIVDTLQYETSGSYIDYISVNINVSNNPELDPDETGTYSYEFEFAPIPRASYRNKVNITITNHEGHINEEFGPEIYAYFTLPDIPNEVEYIDETATIIDSAKVYDNDDNEVNYFSLEYTENPPPWNMNDSGTITYKIKVTNNITDSSLTGKNYFLRNTATLTEDDTNEKREASAEVIIKVPSSSPPPPPPPSVTPLTIGYWKTHAGFTGKNPDKVTPLLPIWLGKEGGAKSIKVTTAKQAVEILSMTGGASNGIVKLYAQLLAAKLNIKNGADGTSVAGVIADADEFLANNNASDWSKLNKDKKKQVLDWMTALDNFNNGY